ncbi:MAG TPA: MJ0042-type zinc finger domain-containing protein [Polyangiaceae bacterium]|nr:MJ0042-type zinc finger domain-containing protein [Polyangiaceae bacterium]
MSSVPPDRSPTPVFSQGEEKDPVMEIRCPKCKAKIKVTVSQAEAAMKVRCPKGHDVPLVKAF